MPEQLYLQTEIKKELNRLNFNADLQAYEISFESKTYKLSDFNDLIVLENILRNLKNGIVTISGAR